MSTRDYLGSKLYDHLRCYADLGWPAAPTNAPIPLTDAQREARKKAELAAMPESDRVLAMMFAASDEPEDDFDESDEEPGEVEYVCSCRNPDCADIGKHPVFKKTTCEPTADLHGLINSFIGAKRFIGTTPNVQLAPGEKGGFWVLDVDARHGGDKSLASLIGKYGPLPHTPSVSNGPGTPVKHYFFGYDARLFDCELAPGLEIIAGPKLVVSAPSTRADGGVVTWVVKPWEPRAPTPAWIFTELAKTPETPKHFRDCEWYEKSPPTALARAIQTYNEQHRENWLGYNRRCPICGHNGCFGPLNGERDAVKWKCFSAEHSGYTTGGAADIHAHQSKVPVHEFLKVRGYL